MTVELRKLFWPKDLRQCKGVGKRGWARQEANLFDAMSL
jgi:hypothetical protein